jgi:hypothetical protein
VFLLTQTGEAEASRTHHPTHEEANTVFAHNSIPSGHSRLRKNIAQTREQYFLWYIINQVLTNYSCLGPVTQLGCAWCGCMQLSARCESGSYLASDQTWRSHVSNPTKELHTAAWKADVPQPRPTPSTL